MAKSKNHTAHNQTRKQHKNGIHRPARQRFASTKGMDPKFLRNQRRATKGRIEKAKGGKWFVFSNSWPQVARWLPRRAGVAAPPVMQSLLILTGSGGSLHDAFKRANIVTLDSIQN